MLTIIRGLPGSGKSTLAHIIANDTGAEHYEADHYFMINGEYKFDPLKLKMAHEWCKLKVKECLDKDKDVIVSNTFTQLWEMLPYLEMASEVGCSHLVIICQGKWQNVHNVPAEVIERMRSRWEW